MKAKRLRVGVVQNCAVPDAQKNIAGLVSQIEDASSKGAELIALPEACEFLHPEDDGFVRHAQALDAHPAALALRSAAQRASAWLLIGSLTVRGEDGKLANRSILVSPDGEIRATYDKINLFDAAPGEKENVESSVYTRGGTAVIVDIGTAKLGLSVCYDLRFPLLYRTLAQHGANVLAVPSAFYRITGEAHWHTLLRARAIETGCFVLAPDQCGSPHPGRENFGHSLVINPWGEILAEAGPDPEVIVADLDLGEVDEARRRIPSLGQNFDFSVAGR
jgi:deaminated glutathione amidase